jgi:hypothetical protein
MYRFAYETNAMDGLLGACHGLEDTFIFSTLDSMAGDRPDRFQMAEIMGPVWATFARNGDPNVAGMPEWPPYNTLDRPTMILELESRVENAPGKEGLAVLGFTPSIFDVHKVQMQRSTGSRKDEAVGLTGSATTSVVLTTIVTRRGGRISPAALFRIPLSLLADR